MMLKIWVTEEFKNSIFGGILTYTSPFYHPLVGDMSLQNLASLALQVSDNHCLVTTGRRSDRQTDMVKSIFLIALIKNIYTL